MFEALNASSLSVFLQSQSVSIIVAALILAFIWVVSGNALRKDSRNGEDEGADVSMGLRREQGLTSSTALNQLAEASDDERVLNPAVFKKFRVLQVTKISHNTRLIRFEIPFGKSLGLPIGRHITVRAEINGNKVMRAYTPTSRPDQCGYFDLLVKVYEYGKMSTHLHSLVPGATLEVRGPVGRFKYTKNMYKCMGFVAGGTGLTPCLQVIRCILDGKDKDGDVTSFVLLFQNRTEEDILLRDELDEYAKKHSDRLNIQYFLSNPSTKEWGSIKTNEHRGYIDKSKIQTYLEPNKCQMIGVCGPSGFNNSIQQLLYSAGHSEESVYIW